LDAAEPPRIVFEDTAKCSDSDAAAVALRLPLGAPHESTTGWTIALKIERRGARAVRAAGTITDSRGATVASRMLFGTGPDCAALAQAMGVWASLVLDAEGKRPHTAAAETQPPSAPVAKPATDSNASAAADAPVTVPWPAPEPRETPSPEHDWYLQHDTGSRALELGLSGFLMSGTIKDAGAMVGPSPFLYIEAGHGIFLRPSLSFGQTVKQSGTITGTWLGSRFDTCVRLPGLYPNRSGIQLDMCAGADVALTLLDSGQSLPFVALGPSVDLRGELGGNLAVALRGVGGINVLTESIVDNGETKNSATWSGRVELAFSWSLR
jgi:hypothetical protein